MSAKKLVPLLVLLTPILGVLGQQAPAEASGVQLPSDIPKALTVSAGYHLVAKAEARGLQIYKAVKSSNGALNWILDKPIATLVDDNGKTIYHYGGPTWQAADGSAITRDTAGSMISTPAKNVKHDVGWLLVKVLPKADSKPANGLFSKVGYAQRLATDGGTAPTAAPARADSEVGVPYTAVYAFYARD